MFVGDPATFNILIVSVLEYYSRNNWKINFRPSRTKVLLFEKNKNNIHLNCKSMLIIFEKIIVKKGELNSEILLILGFVRF